MPQLRHLKGKKKKVLLILAECNALLFDLNLELTEELLGLENDKF